MVRKSADEMKLCQFGHVGDPLANDNTRLGDHVRLAEISGERDAQSPLACDNRPTRAILLVFKSVSNTGTDGTVVPPYLPHWMCHVA